MSDIEKHAHTREISSGLASDADAGAHGVLTAARPTGWKYRSLKLGSYRFPWYASPPSQLLVVSLVCFLCPGMFNALGGLGGGGQVDTTTADEANIALYATFAVVGFFAGTLTNRLGVKFALSFGGLGYCIYTASFLCYSHTKNRGFNIFAGVLLGACAGLLWSAQGAIMMSYPKEESKGRYIAWFWIIFNLGAVIGSLVRNLPTLFIFTISLSDSRYRFHSAKISILESIKQSRTAPILHSSFSHYLVP